ncbi:MAG: ribose-5-phosphate isomerase RpiA [Candidatus Micrarchaeota archaeon]|nr:ribose-5-phosphate isomerase RpiA [Candidatus Micrarchaeota archaeon]
MNGRFNAAEKALEFVKSGMVVGLGSGKTSEIFIKLLGKKVKENKMRVVCVPTSVRTEKVAKKAGLVVRKLNEVKEVDLAVDGADQVDMKLNLIKGYGGALLREKIVDYGAKRFVVIVDESKLRGELSGWIPLEVSPFAVEQVRRELKKLGMEEKTRMKKERKFITDNWNVIIDVRFVKINNPKSVDVFLRSIPGVIETGIFSEKVSMVIVGSKTGVKLLS